MASFPKNKPNKRREDQRQLHLRESYERMRDLTYQFEKEIEEMEKNFMEVCQKMHVNLDIHRKRPSDPSWQHYGYIPFSLGIEENVEEEFEWIVRDIQTWASFPIPRSSTLSVALRAFDDAELEGIDEGAHLFYKILRADDFKQDWSVLVSCVSLILKRYKHTPSIKFTHGKANKEAASQQLHDSSKSSNTVSATRSESSGNFSRFKRRPLTEEEIRTINLGGAS